jgi:hypothetical protein
MMVEPLSVWNWRGKEEDEEEERNKKK